jgi:hypothetical protein
MLHEWAIGDKWTLWFLVPEGQNESSLARSAWKVPKKGTRPVGTGLIPITRLVFERDEKTTSVRLVQTVPSGTTLFSKTDSRQ